MPPRHEQGTLAQTLPLVRITGMAHIVLRVENVEESLRFYSDVLGLKPERVELWRRGEVPFPSARLNDDTIIDLFAASQATIGKDGVRNQDHFCMVIESKDMHELKAKFESMGVVMRANVRHLGADYAPDRRIEPNICKARWLQTLGRTTRYA